MSAFFVSRQTVHDSVQAWIICQPRPRSKSDLDQIGRRLWAMNAHAMRMRYPSIIGTEEDRQNDGDAAAYVYFPPRNASPAQLAKSAHCLHYQCSEGDIGEGNPVFDPLYADLSRICKAMGKPAGWDNAEWGRESDAA